MLPQNGRSLLIDSGAFSAWNSGASIDLTEYAEWCLGHLEDVDVFVNLDVIPGRPGHHPSSVEVEESAKRGWKNYHFMVRRGIPPEKLIHVFHQGESWKWLEMMLDLPYIGLSPANDRSTRDKCLWLERCMEVVTDKEGMPLNKWHGFAVTSPDLMSRFPWYSVDSATWGMAAVWGKISVYRKEALLLIHVTKPEVLERYRYLIEPRMELNGISCIEELTGPSPAYRMRWNAAEVQRFVDENIPIWPWPYKRKEALLF